MPSKLKVQDVRRIFRLAIVSQLSSNKITELLEKVKEDNPRSTFTLYYTTILKTLHSWRSKKQRTLALSSIEAEYMALSEAIRVAVWFKAFMRALGQEAGDGALKVSEDNQGAIVLAKNPEFHKRTKHIDIRYHFVREKVEDGQVLLEYCPTQDMLADIMTKPITAVQLDVLRTKLGIQVAIESSGSVEDGAADVDDDDAPRSRRNASKQ